MILFDSHSHLNDPAFDEDREDVIARMRAGGMAGAMVIACNDEDLPKTIEIVEAHPGFLFGAWAVHPEYPDHREADEEEIARVAMHPQFKAVGETGLDFYWCKEPLDWQRERFRKHIRAAKIAKKPLIIHARDAEGAALDILEAEHAGDTGFVMHCFCGTIDEARRAVDLGGHVSFTGNLTFKRNDALREVARSVPLTRLLLETDCPYMAPVPFRGKRAEPLHVEWLARLHAELHDTDADTAARVTTENAVRLFDLPRTLLGEQL